MKTEAVLFAGVAAFFAVTAGSHGWLAADPAGTAVLSVAFVMASLVSFFLAVQYRRRGRRPQDRRDAEVAPSTAPVGGEPARASATGAEPCRCQTGAGLRRPTATAVLTYLPPPNDSTRPRPAHHSTAPPAPAPSARRPTSENSHAKGWASPGRRMHRLMRTLLGGTRRIPTAVTTALLALATRHGRLHQGQHRL
ncbi:cytochrome c oxidase subunit 4 [Streptomyces sp. NPDC002838]|uniref:aa3-type cytochrome oxidase subunit IV n=1 Tax=Streptomyces sp. NPDC002838 TaxID=3154436 RepID=UPI00332E539D